MVLRAFGRPLPAMIRPPTTGLRRPLPAMNRPPFLVPMLTLGPAPQAHKGPVASVVSCTDTHRYATQLSFHSTPAASIFICGPGGRGRAGRVGRPRGVTNSGRLSPTVCRRRRPMPLRLSRHRLQPMPGLRRRRGGPDFFRTHFGPFGGRHQLLRLYFHAHLSILLTPLPHFSLQDAAASYASRRAPPRVGGRPARPLRARGDRAGAHRDPRRD